jgi:hypothetical protein
MIKLTLSELGKKFLGSKSLSKKEIFSSSWAITISLVVSLISISGFNKDSSLSAFIFLKLILICLYFFESKIEE